MRAARNGGLVQDELRPLAAVLVEAHVVEEEAARSRAPGGLRRKRAGMIRSVSTFDEVDAAPPTAVRVVNGSTVTPPRAERRARR